MRRPWAAILGMGVEMFRGKVEVVGLSVESAVLEALFKSGGHQCHPKLTWVPRKNVIAVSSI